MHTTATHEPYAIGDPCTVVYLHRGGLAASNATVTGVRQLPRSDGWMVTARAHDTGLEVDTAVSADGRSNYLAFGYDRTVIPNTQHATHTPHGPAVQEPPRLPAGEARMIVTVRGPQGPAVTTHNRQPGDGRPAVLVTYAGVLTVCHGPASVGRRARAWLGALELADEGHLPDANRSTRFVDQLDYSAGIVATEEPEPVHVSGHSADSGRDGCADVIVRVGALSMRCLDRDALVSIAAAWADADRLARIVWSAESIANRPQL